VSEALFDIHTKIILFQLLLSANHAGLYPPTGLVRIRGGHRAGIKIGWPDVLDKDPFSPYHMAITFQKEVSS